MVARRIVQENRRFYDGQDQCSNEKIKTWQHLALDPRASGESLQQRGTTGRHSPTTKF